MTEAKIVEMIEYANDYTNLPVWIYKESVLVDYYPKHDLPKSFINSYVDEMLMNDKRICYFHIADNVIFLKIKVDDLDIISGPASEFSLSKKQIDSIVKGAKLNQEDEEKAYKSLYLFSGTPLNLLINYSCGLYFQLTGIKIDVNEVIVSGGDIKRPESKNKSIYTNFSHADNSFIFNESVHEFENRIIECVKSGNEIEIDRICNDFPGKVSIKATDELRHYKNLFIILTTIVSRATIECNFPPVEALALADHYILRAEEIIIPSQMYDLMIQMLKAFTVCVKEVKMPVASTYFTKRVYAYIQDNLSKKITVETMAEDFKMSRNTLSKRFKDESGYFLSDYILTQKIERAKFLLQSSELTYLEIGEYLGFSSQSHFYKSFKKVMNMNPGEFRKIKYYEKVIE